VPLVLGVVWNQIKNHDLSGIKSETEKNKRASLYYVDVFVRFLMFHLSITETVHFHSKDTTDYQKKNSKTAILSLLPSKIEITHSSFLAFE